MKLYCALLLHESNSFSPLPTTRDDFQRLDPAGATLAAPGQPPPHDLALHQACIDAGHEVVHGPCATAVPSAPTNRADYEALRDALLEGLKCALPVDAVLLFLHGAQMAQGCDDCEGDILSRIRAMAGQDLPIGVLLDLHCNVSPAMMHNANILVACKEYPHVDFHESARHLVALATRMAQGGMRAVTHFEPVPLLGFFHTSREPMRSFVDSLRALEGTDGILSVSLAHGYPAADSTQTGAGVLVVAESAAVLSAQAIARKLAREFFALRGEISARGVSAEQAVQLALQRQHGPVVIADVSDNPGGGAPGDSTHLLRVLIEGQVTRAALATIWDPVAFDLICKAGVGGRFALRLGGKTGPLAGAPVDLEASVLSICPDTCQRVFGTYESLGPTAAIRHQGVVVVVSARRSQVFSPEVFRAHGLEALEQHILIVKSAQHFHAEFSRIARDIIYASPPGLIGNDFSHYPYRKVQRPLWPLDETPFSTFGQTWS